MTIRKLPELPSGEATARADGAVLAPAAVKAFNPALVAAEAGGENVITLFGVVGGNFFGEGITLERVRQQLEKIGNGDVVALVNSPGGFVTEGVAIYNLFRLHEGKVTMRVIGLAASIMSVIVMAGDRIEIASAGFFFLHNSEGIAEGNRHTMEEAFESLAEIDDTMRRVYAARTGLKEAEVETIMDGTNNGGTLMGAPAAIDQGFADALMPADAVTEDKTAQRAQRAPVAAHRLDAILAKAGVARGERRRMISDLRNSGTPRAADDATQDAGERGGIQASLAALDDLLNKA